MEAERDAYIEFRACTPPVFNHAWRRRGHAALASAAARCVAQRPAAAGSMPPRGGRCRCCPAAGRQTHDATASPYLGHVRRRQWPRAAGRCHPRVHPRAQLQAPQQVCTACTAPTEMPSAVCMQLGQKPVCVQCCACGTGAVLAPGNPPPPEAHGHIFHARLRYY